jgi:hypothetical protein
VTGSCSACELGRGRPLSTTTTAAVGRSGGPAPSSSSTVTEWLSRRDVHARAGVLADDPRLARWPRAVPADRTNGVSSPAPWYWWRHASHEDERPHTCRRTASTTCTSPFRVITIFADGGDVGRVRSPCRPVVLVRPGGTERSGAVERAGRE